MSYIEKAVREVKFESHDKSESGGYGLIVYFIGGNDGRGWKIGNPVIR